MRPPEYKTEYCKIAQDILANGESLAGICGELDISRTTLYNWRDQYPDFKDAIDRGLQKAQREWERVGMDGIKGNYDKFSSSPWIFTMKNRFRDDYKDDKEQKPVSDTIVDRLIDRLTD